jgi:hypothetical protein
MCCLPILNRTKLDWMDDKKDNWSKTKMASSEVGVEFRDTKKETKLN